MEEAVIGSLLLRPELVALARQYFVPDDFNGPMQKAFEGILQAEREGAHIDAQLIAARTGIKIETLTGAIAKVETPMHGEDYIQVHWNEVFQTQMIASASQMLKVARAEGDIFEKLRMWHNLFRQVEGRIVINFPKMSNPAEILRHLQTWSCRTGIKVYDQIFRLVSSGLTTIVGNPNSGKTTMALHVGLFNATENPIEVNRPTHLFLSETDVLEAQLSFLTMTKRITAKFANELRYQPYSRTSGAISKIEGLWTDFLEDVPLYVHSMEGRSLQDVLEIAGRIRESMIILDHMYAFIWQGETTQNAYSDFAMGFSEARRLATEGNNVVIVFNQYTKTEQGRKNAWKQGEAGFGGAAQFNMSQLKINLRASPDMGTPRLDAVESIVVKAKVSLVETQDEFGNFHPVNPNGRTTIHFIDRDYRWITDFVSIYDVNRSQSETTSENDDESD